MNRCLLSCFYPAQNICTSKLKWVRMFFSASDPRRNPCLPDVACLCRTSFASWIIYSSARLKTTSRRVSWWSWRPVWVSSMNICVLPNKATARVNNGNRFRENASAVSNQLVSVSVTRKSEEETEDEEYTEWQMHSFRIAVDEQTLARPSSQRMISFKSRTAFQLPPRAYSSCYLCIILYILLWNK